MMIDKQRLLQSLKREADTCAKEKFRAKDRFYMGRETVLLDVIRQVESGVYDRKEESQ